MRERQSDLGLLCKKNVDFVAIKSDEKLYIQVSDNITDDKSFQREVSPLLSIRDAYPKILIAGTRHDAYQYEGIRIVDFSDWLTSISLTAENLTCNFAFQKLRPIAVMGISAVIGIITGHALAYRDKKLREFRSRSFRYMTVFPLCRAMSLPPIISFISSNAGIPVQCPL